MILINKGTKKTFVVLGRREQKCRAKQAARVVLVPGETVRE
jgi:hypothetical protein